MSGRVAPGCMRWESPPALQVPGEGPQAPFVFWFTWLAIWGLLCSRLLPAGWLLVGKRRW